MELICERKVIQPISLLLLEINMSGLSGFEVNKKVKEAFEKANQRLL